MKEIPLTKGYVALVDDEDYERIAQHKWTANVSASGNRVYAARTTSRAGGRRARKILMHREVMGFPEGMLDHRVGIGLDNQKHNLRACTRQQNFANTGPRKTNSHGRKGISRTPSGRWQVRIHFNGKKMYLGTYDDPELGSCAYLAKAMELHGEFARN